MPDMASAVFNIEKSIGHHVHAFKKKHRLAAFLVGFDE